MWHISSPSSPSLASLLSTVYSSVREEECVRGAAVWRVKEEEEGEGEGGRLEEVCILEQEGVRW